MRKQVVAPGLLDPGDPSQQDHLEQHEIGRQQAGQKAERADAAVEGGQTQDAFVDQPDADDDDHRSNPERSEQIRPAIPPAARAANGGDRRA